MAANELVGPIHERMPLILPPEAYARWLSHDTPVAQLQTLLKLYPAQGMQGVSVGPAVNKVTNDGPECIAPAA